MNNSTALIRIRFPHDVVDRLDKLAAWLQGQTRRSVPRAAVVRALVLMHMEAVANGEDITGVLGADPVKRGREKGQRSARMPPIARHRIDHSGFRASAAARP
jgi:hypothetical protein